MTTNRISVPVSELRAGDIFMDGDMHVWTALMDAHRTKGGHIAIAVQYVLDGARNVREWADPDIELMVERDVPA